MTELFTNDILKCQEYVLSNISIHRQRILDIYKSDIGDERRYILTCPAMNDVR
jgi:hypothetical protein